MRPAELAIPSRYFKGMAGMRFKVRVVGSTKMPTDSKAVTPKSGTYQHNSKRSKTIPLNMVFSCLRFRSSAMIRTT